MFPTFNVNPRLCLGKRMAEFETVCLVASLIRDFKFTAKNVMSALVSCRFSSLDVFRGDKVG